MAWHNRYISSSKESTAPGGKTRLIVEFRRRDLLWISPCPFINSKTGETFTLPIRIGSTVAVGANILDMIFRETIEVWSDQEVTTPDGTQETVKIEVEKLIWRQRKPDELFAKKKGEAASDYPLRKSLTTGGTVLGEQGDFLEISKRSSVSINALVYRLAIAMTGSHVAASQYIGTIAAATWERDLTRALELYTLIAQAPDGFLLDQQVPDALKASASIAQTVETAVLRAACNWLGINPDTPLGRKRGRPRTRSRNEAGSATSAGQVIELTLQEDGTVTGRLISNFHSFPENTNLATLTLTNLASILVALRERELVDDADLLEAYLEAIDPDWRAKIASEIGVDDGSNTIDPWAILGVEPGVSLEQVKNAYKRIMRTVHPDTSGLPRWYAQTVNDAYRQLLKELEDG